MKKGEKGLFSSSRSAVMLASLLYEQSARARSGDVDTGLLTWRSCRRSPPVQDPLQFHAYDSEHDEATILCLIMTLNGKIAAFVLTVV